MEIVGEVKITELRQTDREIGAHPTIDRSLSVDLGYGSIVRSAERDGRYPSGSQKSEDDWEMIPFSEEQLNTVVVPFDEVIIQISYPLSRIANFLVQNKGGLTLRQTINVCSDIYHFIYDKEEETTETPAKLGCEGGAAPAFNRCRTNGKYGIWGHVITDLMMHSLHHRMRLPRLEVAILEGIGLETNEIHFFDVSCDS